MAKLLRLRRGTTTQHGSFTGAEGEVTVDTDKDTLVVHDNATAGGRPMLREDLNNMPASGVTAGTYGSSSAIPAITVDAKGRVTSATTSAIDSTSIANGTSNVSVAASGDITVTRDGSTVASFNSVGIDLLDNKKAAFGDGDDLQIYHDGTNSYVHDTGTGHLILSGTELYLNNGANNKSYFLGINGGASSIYYDGSQKLLTTSSGVNVIGTVTCDGMTCDGDATIQSGHGRVIIKDSDSSATSAQSELDFQDSNGTVLGYVGYTSNGDNVLSVLNRQNESIRFGSNNTWRASINASGHFEPYANNTYDLGTSGNQWRDGYFDGTVYCDGLTCDGDATIAASTGVLTIKDNNSSGDTTTCYVQGANSNGAVRWRIGQEAASNEWLYFVNNANAGLVFTTNGLQKAYLDPDGHFYPAANNAYDLGTSGNRWRNVYTNDLNLSNEGGANDVDGTWGNWTIQEGEDDLFLLNRRNGKKYKFNLSEVN